MESRRDENLSSGESSSAAISESTMSPGLVRHGLIPTFVADLTPTPLKFQKPRDRMGNYSQRVISNKRSFEGEFDEDSTKGVRHGMAMKNKNKKRTRYSNAADQFEDARSKGQAPIPYSILESLDDEEDDQDYEDLDPVTSEEGEEMADDSVQFESVTITSSQIKEEQDNASESRDWSAESVHSQSLSSQNTLASPQPTGFELNMGASVPGERQYIQVLIQLADGQFAPVQIPVEALMQGTPSTPPLLLQSSPLTMPVMSSMLRPTTLSPMPTIQTRTISVPPPSPGSAVSSPVPIMPSVIKPTVTSIAVSPIPSPNIIMQHVVSSNQHYMSSPRPLSTKVVPTLLPQQQSGGSFFIQRPDGKPQATPPPCPASPGGSPRPALTSSFKRQPGHPMLFVSKTVKAAPDAASMSQGSIASSTRKLLSARLQTNQHQTVGDSLHGGQFQTNNSSTQYSPSAAPGHGAKVPRLASDIYRTIVSPSTESALDWSPVPGGGYVTLQAADTSTHLSVDDGYVPHNSLGGDGDEEDERKRYLDSNRAAANRCRNKKKSWVNNLEVKTCELQTENKQIMKEMDKLRNEITFFKQTLEDHKDCPTTTTTYSYIYSDIIPSQDS